MVIKSNLKNMVIVLTAVCLICSSVLAGVYAMTKEPIDAAAREKTDKAIALVLPAFDETEEAATVVADGKEYRYYSASKDGETVGYAVESSATGFGGTLSLMVGITVDGKVYNTSVLSHGETPGLGAKCTDDKAFTEQWKGFDPSVKTLAVKKDGGDVDAITASTITSRAYTLAVSNAVDAFKSITAQEDVNNE